MKGFTVCKNKLEEIWTVEGDETINCVDFTSSKKGVKAAGS